MLNIQTVQSEHKRLSLHLPSFEIKKNNNNEVQGQDLQSSRKGLTFCLKSEVK